MAPASRAIAPVSFPAWPIITRRRMPRSLHKIVIAALLLGLVPARAAEPVKLAFVDTGNTGRSVTAEALANERIAKDHLPIAVISRALDQDPYAAKPDTTAAALL